LNRVKLFTIQQILASLILACGKSILKHSLVWRNAAKARKLPLMEPTLRYAA